MKFRRLALLVVGGPQELLTATNSSDIEQLPFTFQGLGKAYQSLPRAHAVVLIPDEDIFASMPMAEHFAGFVAEEGGGLNPIFAKLGLLAPAPIGTGVPGSNPKTPKRKSVPPKAIPLRPDEKSVAEQTKTTLDLIQQSDQPSFIKRAASEFLLEILKRSATLVNGGGTVYILLPRIWNESSDDLRELIHQVAPGIQVGQDPTWASHIKGGWDWILKDVESELYFDLATDYYHENSELNSGDVPKVLPNPDCLLKFLEPDVELHYVSGATDRTGTQRVLVFSWGEGVPNRGEGSFILAPNVCLPVIIERLSEKKAATDLPHVAPQVSFDKESSPDQKKQKVSGKRKYERAPDIGHDKKQEVSKIWTTYKTNCKQGKGELKLPEKPTFSKCFEEYESELADLGIGTSEDFKKTYDSMRKGWARRG